MQTAQQQLQNQCLQLLDNDFKNEISAAIINRGRWQFLNKTLDVSSHLLTGTTTVLAFMAAAVHLPVLSIVAGCAGVCAGVSMSYSQYCKNQYKNQTKIIQSMSNSIGIQDILPDDSSEMNNDNRTIPQTEASILTSYQQTSIVNTITPAPTPTTEATVENVPRSTPIPIRHPLLPRATPQ